MKGDKLTGVIPPLITPLIDNNTLDVEGLERLIEHVIKGGVHGVFILGTTGEAASLSIDLSVQMIQESSRILQGRVPLLVGISDTSITNSVYLSEVAHEAKADAVVSTPPFYFTLSQEELLQYYQTLLSYLSLPLYLYNMPVNTNINFEPETIKSIAKHPLVAGFKDSSANATYLQKVMYEMRNHTNFSIFVGPEEMTAEMILLGADGGVNGGANIFPQLYVNLYNAATSNNLDEVNKLQTKVMEISSSIYAISEDSSSYLKGVKGSLGILNICSDFIAQPYTGFTRSEKEQLERYIQDVLRDMDMYI